MKKIFIILSFFLISISTSQSREENYIGWDVSDLLKKGFKIIKQEQKDYSTLVFLTNNRDYVVCSVSSSSTFCEKK
jgi:hypothetical protein